MPVRGPALSLRFSSDEYALLAAAVQDSGSPFFRVPRRRPRPARRGGSEIIGAPACEMWPRSGSASHTVIL